jgi:hypothetical protein
MPYPYYPYYVPNQYPSGAYQSSGYGQPYVNKNMYPMYHHPHQPVSTPRKQNNFPPYVNNTANSGYQAGNQTYSNQQSYNNQTPYGTANSSMYDEAQSHSQTTGAGTQGLNTNNGSGQSGQDFLNKSSSHGGANQYSSNNPSSNTPFLGMNDVQGQPSHNLNPSLSGSNTASKANDRTQQGAESNTSGRFMHHALPQQSMGGASYYNQYSYPGHQNPMYGFPSSGVFNHTTMQHSYGYGQGQQGSHGPAPTSQALPAQGSPSTRASGIGSKQGGHNGSNRSNASSHSHQQTYWSNSQS